MTVDRYDDAASAATLIGYTLRPTMRPGAEEGYRELMERHATDASFRELVTAICDGLGLEVVGTTDAVGLALSPHPGSPFMPTRTDLTTASTAEERLVAGLATFGVAVHCFPTAGSLEREGLVDFTLIDVSRTLTAICERLAADHAQTEQLDEGSEGLAEAWETWLGYAETGRTKTGRPKRNTRLGALDAAIKTLADSGLVREVAQEKWRTTDRLRLQMRHAGNALHLSLLRAAHRDAVASEGT